MAVISVQNVTAAFSGDSQALCLYWGPFQAGDEGAPISVYAYPRFAWHFTGFSNYDLSQPNVPIMPDRTMTVLGSNDKNCWGPAFIFDNIDAPGMNARINDPMRASYTDGAYAWIKPKAGGSINPAGPDCGLLLFCSKLWAPRS